MTKQDGTDQSNPCQEQEQERPTQRKRPGKGKQSKAKGPTAERHERLLKLMALEARAKLDFAYSIKSVAIDLGLSEHGPPPDLHYGTLRLLWFAAGLPISGEAATARGAFLRWFEGDEWEPHEVISHLRDVQKSLSTTEPVQKPVFDPDLSHLCESPIETMFYDACAESYSYQRAAFGNQFEVDKSTFGNLRPNYQIGPYRVDFAVVDHRIAVELDGHEWHKTKKQRTSDAERERHIENNGWLVVRFTGSEVFKNVSLCVEELENAISHHGDGGTYGRDISKIQVFGSES